MISAATSTARIWTSPWCELQEALSILWRTLFDRAAFNTHGGFCDALSTGRSELGVSSFDSNSGTGYALTREASNRKRAHRAEIHHTDRVYRAPARRIPTHGSATARRFASQASQSETSSRRPHHASANAPGRRDCDRGRRLGWLAGWRWRVARSVSSESTNGGDHTQTPAQLQADDQARHPGLEARLAIAQLIGPAVGATSPRAHTGEVSLRS